jgi:hypothetical protein
MLFADGALVVVLFAVWVFCLIDVITTDQSQIRHLPKVVWVLIVLVLVDLGSVLWLIAGRTWQKSATAAGPTGRSPEYDRPGRAVASNPDDDEHFLRGLRERADEQRRGYDQTRPTERPTERPIERPIEGLEDH